MTTDAKHRIGPATRWLATGAGLAATTYAAYVSATWFRYGRVRRKTNRADADPLLDRFMPIYEVFDRHHARIAAPAEITLTTACEMDLEESAIIRAIFNCRALMLASKPPKRLLPRTLFA